jgi:hypothetical protein
MEAVGMTPGRLVERDTEMGWKATLREYTISRADWAARHVSAFSVFDDGRVVEHEPPRRAPVQAPAGLVEAAPETVTGELQHA